MLLGARLAGAFAEASWAASTPFEGLEPPGLAKAHDAQVQSATVSPPVWLTHAPRVRAGHTAHYTLDPVSAAMCKVRVTGPSGAPVASRTLVGNGQFARISLRTRVRAAAGRWQLQASCLQPSGAVLAAKTTTRVRSPRGRKRGALVGSRGFRVSRTSSSPTRTGKGGIVKGRGAGANPFDPTQCTYLAYEKREDVYDQAVNAGVPAGGLEPNAASSDDYIWNGKHWSENARRAGIPTGVTPVVGALFVNTGGRYGHVAYVDQVFPDGTYDIVQRNQSGRSDSTAETHSTMAPGRPGIEFVYGGPAGAGPTPPPSAYAGHIVQWNGDTKQQKTAWLVGPDLKRRWIQTSAVYGCLKNLGHPGPDVLSADQLNALPDQTGRHVTCVEGKGVGDEADDPGNSQPPPPKTSAETEGGVGATAFAQYHKPQVLRPTRLLQEPPCK